MSKVGKRKNRLGQKQPPSTRLFVTLETVATALAAAVIVASGIVFAASEHTGLVLFGTLLWPLVLFLAVAIFLGVGQLLRGRHTLALVMLIAALAVLGVGVGAIVFECVRYGTFYLVPFTIVRS